MRKADSNLHIDKINELYNSITGEPSCALEDTELTDDTIREVESRLGVILPTDYVDYLKTWGAFSVESYEFTGLLNNDTNFDEAIFPSVVFFTESERNNRDVSPYYKDNYIVFLEESSYIIYIECCDLNKYRLIEYSKEQTDPEPTYLNCSIFEYLENIIKVILN